MLQTILAFSSSRCGSGAYLENVAPVIKEVVGDQSLKVAFVPFASVINSYEAYGNMVRTGLDSYYSISVVEHATATQQIEEADIIMIGGGNTFKLLHHLYQYHLVELIKEKVNSGTPYIGWSAGANITGLSISTTNDMPIIQPQSFEAFGFFPFQINPHYINYTIPGHNGESRDQRLMEFMHQNKGTSVVCLPEGTAIIASNGDIKYCGKDPGVVFVNEPGKEAMRRHVEHDESLSFLVTN